MPSREELSFDEAAATLGADFDGVLVRDGWAPYRRFDQAMRHRRHTSATHLAVEFPAAFTFLLDPSIDATNCRAEQALRSAVVTRKIWGGNRTLRGAHTQHVLASVLRTLQQRDLHAAALPSEILRVRGPIVPLALTGVPQ